MTNLEGRASETRQIARWFEYEHLPHHLKKISRACGDLADEMIFELCDGPELWDGLRSLLRAKDSFVRAMIERNEL
jgi:hypothetical protein